MTSPALTARLRLRERYLQRIADLEGPLLSTNLEQERAALWWIDDMIAQLQVSPPDDGQLAGDDPALIEILGRGSILKDV